MCELSWFRGRVLGPNKSAGDAMFGTVGTVVIQQRVALVGLDVWWGRLGTLVISFKFHFPLHLAMG